MTIVRITLLSLLAAFGPVSFLSAEVNLEHVLYPENVFPELTPLLHTALQNSPELEARQAAVEERRGQSLSQAAASRSRVRADVQVLAGYEFRYNPDTVNGLYESVESRARMGLNASLWWHKPLYYWGNNERQRQIADLYVSASETEFAETSRRHLNSVRETYLLWMAARHQLEVAAENLELAERFVSNRRELLRIGRTSQQEVLELEAGLYEAQESLALYARDQTYLRRQLELMVGDEQALAALDREAFPEIPLLSLDEIDGLRQKLAEANPEVLAVEREELNAEADRTYYEAVKRQRRPVVDLVVGAVSDRVDSYNIDDSAYRISSYAGVNVSWNIFDGHRNRGERMSALARIRAREARIEMMESQTRSGAEHLLSNLELFVRQVEARSLRAELLERRMALAENPDNAEIIAPIERLELRLSLLQAQARVIESKIQYLIHMSRLAALYFPDPVSGL